MVALPNHVFILLSYSLIIRSFFGKEMLLYLALHAG